MTCLCREDASADVAHCLVRRDAVASSLVRTLMKRLPCALPE
jgi:hypothetical protein